MPFLELDLDGIAELKEQMRIPGVDPVTAAGIAEIAGVDGIGITSNDGETRNARLILETTSTRFNWRLPLNEYSIESIMTHPPGMVTFVDPRHESRTVDLRGVADYEEYIEHVKRLGATLVAVRIDPDVKQLKGAYKLGVDHIEINSLPYAYSDTIELREETFDAITDIARVAYKYDMGVSIAGGLTYQNFRALASIEAVDTIVVGSAILGKAIYIGLENALRDFIFLIK